MVKPRAQVPPLELPTLEGGVWKISEQQPKNFTMIVAYRGLHCPICRGYLKELDRSVPELGKRGVEVIAISGDSQERAQRTREEWELEQLTIGYGLSLETARSWGLYISKGKGQTSIGVEEPEYFAEPGLFLVKPQGTLYAAVINTMPFARPRIQDVLAGLDFVIPHDYPVRGEA